MAGPSVDILLKARDEATGVLKRVSGEVGFLASTVQRLSSGLGVWGALGAGVVTAASAVVTAGKKFADTVEQLDRVRAATGLSIQDIQSLQKVWAEAGGNAEDAGAAAAFFAKQIGDGNPLLAQYGIHTRNVKQGLLELSDVIAHTSDVGTQQLLITKLLGKSQGESAVVVASLGRTWSETRDRMARAGALIEDRVTPQARELDRQLDQLALNWQGTWNQMLQDAVPAANRIISKINELYEAISSPPQPGDSKGMLWWFKKFREDKAEWDKEAAALSEELVRQDRIAHGQPVFGGFAGGASGGKGGGGSWGSGGKTTSGEDPRARRISELVRVMQVATPVARQLLEVLDAIETEKKRQGILKDIAGVGALTLGVQGPLTEAQAALGSIRDDLSFDDTRSSGAGLRKIAQPQLPTPKAVKETTAALSEMVAVVQEIRAHYGGLVNDLLSSSALIRNTLDSIWEGLNSGAATIAANIGSKFQTIRSAALTVLNAVRDALARLLAQMAVAGIFKLLLGVALPPINLGIGAGAGRLLRATPARDAVAPAVIHNTFYSWSARDGYMQMNAPSGELRRANETRAYAGAY